MGALVVAISPLVWAFLAVVFVVLVIVVLAASFNGQAKGCSTLACVVAVLLSVVGWVYSSTHAVIPVNQTAVVVNTMQQKVDGEMRPSGLIDIPLWSARVQYYPAQVSYNLTEDEVPAIYGGTAITFTIVYVSDASKIDWKKQYLRQGEIDPDKMFQVWRHKRSSAVSAAVGDVTIADLTTKLDTVGAKIYEKVKPAFDEEGYPLTRVAIKFWDYQNKQAGVLLDEKTAAAKADLEAAKLEQQAALIRADTANQVLVKQTQGLKQAMDALGIVDTQTRGTIMQTFMLIQYLATHPNSMVVISTGGASGPTMLAPQAGGQPTAVPGRQ